MIISSPFPLTIVNNNLGDSYNAFKTSTSFEIRLLLTFVTISPF